VAREQRNQHIGLPVRGEVLPAEQLEPDRRRYLPEPGQPVPPPEPYDRSDEVRSVQAPHVVIGRVRTIPWEPWEGEPFQPEPEPEYDERITAHELRVSGVLAALVFGVFVFSPLGWVGGLILAVFTVVVYLAA
jgi:hypothetical protein